MSFADFDNNPIIRRLAKNPRWTISRPDKAPISMTAFSRYGNILPADFRKPGSLVNLDQIYSICRSRGNELSQPNNCTYYLDVLSDQCVVLDIEPSCPGEVKKELLKLPYLYGERSMSGHGYHLILAVPPCFKDYPVASKKVALKDANGWYEILLNHLVALTRNTIEPCSNLDGTGDFNALYASLASVQKESRPDGVAVQSNLPNLENIYEYRDILQLVGHGKPFAKKPESYASPSNYDFAWLSFKFYEMQKLMTMPPYCLHNYTPEEMAVLLYAMATDPDNGLKHRTKYDQTRHNMPFLLWRAIQVVEKNTVPSAVSAKEKSRI